MSGIPDPMKISTVVKPEHAPYIRAWLADGWDPDNVATLLSYTREAVLAVVPPTYAPYTVIVREASYVYVLTHREFGAAKVGKGIARAGRIGGHVTDGWEVYRAVLLPSESMAAWVEERVLAALDGSVSLGCVPQQLMTRGGYTETVSLEEWPAAELWALVLEAEAKVPETPARVPREL
ncbi:hypothetical protein ABT234_12255 [Streptomyces sp. NPDC001586]|uniref:hypothetical protein n=1 Tax=Streptomyces sp. NPDC001586 TaxID=3154387 RepID=UPI00331AE832